MAEFRSNLGANECVINDDNYRQHLIGPAGKAKGFLGSRMRPRSAIEGRKTFNDLGIPLVPESEWKDRIEEREANKATLKDFSIDAGLPCKDQGRTNYCWINAPTHCSEIVNLLTTGQVISLSPASAGARIKNFANVGGWGSQGLKWMGDHGVNRSSDWPDNEIDRKYNTPENQQKALEFLVVEEYQLQTLQERISCLFANIPIADGYNWWSHEVTGIDPVWNGRIALRSRNSWGMTYGDRGFFVLEGSKMMADDSVAIVSLAMR